MAHKIDTPAARAKLPARRAPYWHKVRPNHFVGFRYMTPGAPGNWVAKIKTGTKERFEPLGQLIDVDPKDRFTTALAMAAKWFDANGSVHVTGTRVTIGDALRTYVEHQREKKGEDTARQAQRRFELLITGFEINGKPFVDFPIVKATHDHYSAWRAYVVALPVQSRGGDGKTARKLSSVNRDLAYFRAALNMTAKRHKLARDAWTDALARDLSADKGNRDWPIVAPKDRPTLFAKMREIAPDMVPFAMMQLIMPIRPGALACVRVKHWNAAAPSLYIEFDKAGADRHVPLPADKSLTKMLRECAKDKTPDAYLFTRANGEQWNADSWSRAMRDVTAAAKLTGVTMYSFRHTRITELVDSNKMPIAAIAKLAGTSIEQIEKHYYHLSDDSARELLGVHGLGALMAA